MMATSGGLNLAKAMKKEDYLYISAALRARETRMLSREKAERMLEAPEFADSAKLLTDCGYEDMSRMSAKEIDEALARHRSEVFDDLAQRCPNRALVDFFRIRYDYHNAKVVLKAEAKGTDGDYLLSECGRVKSNALKEAYLEEHYSALPGKLGTALAEAREILARTSNPQLSDFVLDRAWFDELKTIADEQQSAFLQRYVAVLADSSNLKSAVRTLRMGKNADFLRDTLLPGGRVEPGRFLTALSAEGLGGLFSGSALADAAALGAEAVEGGKLTAFELACDNAVMRVLREAKLTAFGEEAVIAYLAAVENELTAVRMILTGRRMGIEPQVIRERLRDLYA